MFTFLKNIFFFIRPSVCDLWCRMCFLGQDLLWIRQSSSVSVIRTMLHTFHSLMTIQCSVTNWQFRSTKHFFFLLCECLSDLNPSEIWRYITFLHLCDTAFHLWNLSFSPNAMVKVQNQYRSKSDLLAFPFCLNTKPGGVSYRWS